MSALDIFEQYEYDADAPDHETHHHYAASQLLVLLLMIAPGTRHDILGKTLITSEAIGIF